MYKSFGKDKKKKTWNAASGRFTLPPSRASTSSAAAGCRGAWRPSPAPSWRCPGQTVSVRRSPAWTNTRGTSATAWIPAQTGNTPSHPLRHLKASAIKAHLPSCLICDWRTSNHVWSRLKMKRRGMKAGRSYLYGIKIHLLSAWPALIKRGEINIQCQPSRRKSLKITAGCCSWPKPKRGACIIKHDENHVSCGSN